MMRLSKAVFAIVSSAGILGCLGSSGDPDSSDEMQYLDVSAIASISLIDVDTRTVIISSLQNGATIDLSKLPTKNVTLQANLGSGATPASIKMQLDSYVHSENSSPYHLCGDYTACPGLVTVGSHAFTATPYSNYNGTGTPGTSVSVSFNVVASSPTLTYPIDLWGAVQSSSAILLHWSDTNTAESGYLIERSLSASSGFVQIGQTGVNATAYQDSGLAVGTTYYYRLRAFNGLNFSAYSGVAHATTSGQAQPAPPPTPTVGPIPMSCSGVNLSPGQSIQSAVSGHGTGTTFCLAAGTYINQSVVPKDGDAFIGAVGAILDGGGTTQFAFSGTADNVTIKNLTVRYYDTPGQYATIEGGWDTSTGWDVENNDVSYSLHGVGIAVVNNSVFRNNYTHHNAQFGFINKGIGAVLTGNEVAFNNTLNGCDGVGGNVCLGTPNASNYDPNWAAGGMKFLQSDGLQFKNNYVHDNNGPGIWFDAYNDHCVVDGNRVENNAYAGIFYEISYNGTISNNIVTNNGGSGSIARAGILVSASSYVEVFGNTLSGNSNGIVGLQANRGVAPSGRDQGPLGGQLLVYNLWVHDNTVTIQKGITGLVDQVGDGGIFNRNNRYDRNTYYLSGRTATFLDQDGTVSATRWQSRGFDLNGIFNP